MLKSQYSNEAIGDDALGGSGEARGYRKRGTISSSDSEVLTLSLI